eukprot:COSAG06_NODE_1242_length_10121_cov_5.525344_1_plen_226_part_00
MLPAAHRCLLFAVCCCCLLRLLLLLLLQVGESLYDPATDTIFFFENHVDFRIRHPGCSTCALWQMSSRDHGLTWTNQTVIKLADPDANQTEPWGGGNKTFGGGLASGIALQGGPHKGRLLAALRHDCGCNDRPASFVVYSDNNGQSWAGGALLPEPGAGTLPSLSLLLSTSLFPMKNDLFGTRISSGQTQGNLNPKTSAVFLPQASMGCTQGRPIRPTEYVKTVF